MKINAPTVDGYLRWFDDGFKNSSVPTESIKTAMASLFDALAPLAPLKGNNEVKSIWVKIPRGEISDYGSFEEMKEWGEVDTYDEFIENWKETYPNEYSWYELTVSESFNKDGTLRYRGVSVGNKIIISADMGRGPAEEQHDNDAAVELCNIMTAAAKEAVQQMRDGVYNAEVSTSLPYKFRTGVVKRSALWEKGPELRMHTLDGLSEDILAEFRRLLSSGVNDEMKIGRLVRMTANDFFRACSIGYKACGYAIHFSNKNCSVGSRESQPWNNTTSSDQQHRDKAMRGLWHSLCPKLQPGDVLSKLRPRCPPPPENGERTAAQIGVDN